MKDFVDVQKLSWGYAEKGFLYTTPPKVSPATVPMQQCFFSAFIPCYLDLWCSDLHTELRIRWPEIKYRPPAYSAVPPSLGGYIEIQRNTRKMKRSNPDDPLALCQGSRFPYQLEAPEGQAYAYALILTITLDTPGSSTRQTPDTPLFNTH